MLSSRKVSVWTDSSITSGRFEVVVTSLDLAAFGSEALELGSFGTWFRIIK